MARLGSLIAIILALQAGTELSADTVRLLPDESDAFQCRLDLIDSAVTSIDVAYYSIDDDEYSCRFLERLRSAARRGVRVRLIVDGLFNGIPRGLQRHLSHEGIQVREYHQYWHTRPDSICYRMHDKLLLVDGSSVILGGRNISDDYFGDSGRKHYIDMDVLVTGTAVCHAACYYDALWASKHVRSVGRYNFGPAMIASDPAGTIQSFATNPAHLFSDSGAKSLNRCDPTCGCGEVPRCVHQYETVEVSSESLCFLHAGRVMPCREGEISEYIARAISSARFRVIIETPYFVLWDRIERALEAARGRGVRVVILTNSIDSTDNLIVNAELTNQKHRLDKLGIELFEYHGRGILHAKTMIVDDSAMVGSFNLNPRSEYYDSETAIMIRDPVVAEQVLDSVERRHRLSISAVPHDSLKDFLIPPERAAPQKYVSIQLLRWITPWIRKQL